ncbi:MerR family DNA-binding protein [Myxococcota bacterium]|nr:MerR family DNA-binding protein [Myxococcota bacterium]MBU1429564.1 MerR family DNA-binding protein [Myxococcota bacterium]MBU1896572.1 MerR family DNA-binding protein [Myxococcota bacterium]
MAKQLMTIGALSKKTGVPSKTIRYYEEVGVLPLAARGLNGYRRYGEEAIERLSFIARARALGFPLEDVRDLLALWADPHRASAEVKALARKHLDAVEGKIRALEGLRATLETLITHCPGSDEPDCPILNALADAKGGGDHMEKITYQVTGMTCGGCVRALDRALKAALPTAEVEVTLTPGQAHVNGAHEAARVRQAVVEAGFVFEGRVE